MTDTVGAAILARIESLEWTATKQVATMSMMAHQLQALYVVNAAFAGILRHQEGFDFEVLREKVLEVFTDRERDAEAIAYVEALLGQGAVGAISVRRDEELARVREVARGRFAVIDGGLRDCQEFRVRAAG